MERLLKKYKDRILDIEVEDWEIFINLKRPWVIKDCGHYTSCISVETLQQAESQLKQAIQNEIEWNKL